MRKIQIGVMGSAADLNYSKDIERLAEKIGELIAKSGNITVYGAEKDYDSLSTSAARGAKRYGGLTVGVTYGKGKKVYDNKNTDVLIVSGLERGGGREFVLVNSCDVIIAVSGGSGTLTELAIAYQSNIPMIVLKKTGGWSSKLAGKYFDQRKRRRVIGVNSPEQAVNLAVKLAKETLLNSEKLNFSYKKMKMERVEIRPFRFGDYIRFLKVNLAPKTRKEFARSPLGYFIVALKDISSKSKVYKFSVYANERFAGFCAVFNEKGFDEMRMFVLPEFRGRGIATEATRKLIEFCFNDLKYKSIRTIIDKENPEPEKIMKRLSFKMIKNDTKTRMWEKRNEKSPKFGQFREKKNDGGKRK